MTQTFTRTFAYASVRKLVDFSDRAKLDTPTRLLLLENDHSKFAKYIKEVNTNITELKTSVNIGFSGMDATIKKTIHTEMSTWYIKTLLAIGTAVAGISTALYWMSAEDSSKQSAADKATIQKTLDAVIDQNTAAAMDRMATALEGLSRRAGAELKPVPQR